jgi:hypothetical protein
VLNQKPALSKNIRLITIGTGLMLEKNMPQIPKSWGRSAPCVQLNWNGQGRNMIYTNSQFDDLWWIEMNWTYAGMFPGEEPKTLFAALTQYGSMGLHIKEVVKNESWAQYFRVGDTPSVLYLLDPKKNFDDPTQSNWAGKFVKPFPKQRPDYYTDFAGTIDWNYADPCQTWTNHEAFEKAAMQTLLDRRPEMYQAFLKKLDLIYKKNKSL